MIGRRVVGSLLGGTDRLPSLKADKYSKEVCLLFFCEDVGSI